MLSEFGFLFCPVCSRDVRRDELGLVTNDYGEDEHFHCGQKIRNIPHKSTRALEHRPQQASAASPSLVTMD